jgi:hypothetical protein
MSDSVSTPATHKTDGVSQSELQNSPPLYNKENVKVALESKVNGLDTILLCCESVEIYYDSAMLILILYGTVCYSTGLDQSVRHRLSGRN